MFRRAVMRIGIGIVGTGIVASLGIYILSRADVRAGYQRLDGLEREYVETEHGTIEYALRGSGYPVLLVHGNAGGFDQGLDQAAAHVGQDFMVIAPSRFGYLGTPLPKGATPRDQADAFLALLDHLAVQRAAVIAYSAGGPSAMQLALAHPECVSALVLVSTSFADTPMSLPPRFVIGTIARSDSILWTLMHPVRSLTRRMFVPNSYQPTPEEDAEVADVMGKILPIRPRSDGLVFDMFVTNTDVNTHNSQYRLEDLTVPTLVINAKDDPLIPYEDGRATAERIPGARMVTVETGGHLMLGSKDFVPAEIDRFLKENLRERDAD